MSAILFLHGGGHADHTRYTKLVERFAASNIICHAFDHHAHSLLGRQEEAETELIRFTSTHAISDAELFIWGSSMGGHIACRLLSTHPNIRGVILQSAAAYSIVAETLPFGPAFTAELRRANSWQNSPAFSAISSYAGPVLAMYGENDGVIPAEVKARYISRAMQKGMAFTLTSAGHSLLRPSTPFEQQAWEDMYNHAQKFIQETNIHSS